MKIMLNRCGISLVEVIIGAIIAALIALSGSLLPIAFKKASESAEKRFLAIDLSASQIEEIKYIASKDFSDSKLEDSNISGPTPYVATINLPVGFSVNYTVEDADDWETGGDIDYKIIEAACTYDKNRQIKLKTYIVR